MANGGYRPNIYRNYREFIEWYGSLAKNKRDEAISEYEYMVDSLVKPLGGLTCQDVIARHVNTPLGFVRTVKQLMREECFVTADIRTFHGTHCVGLLPTGEDNFVTLVSNHIPKALQGIVSVQKVATRFNPVHDPYMPNFPLNNANIAALPPAT